MFDTAADARKIWFGYGVRIWIGTPDTDLDATHYALRAIHADIVLDTFDEELKTKNRSDSWYSITENTYGRLPSEDVGIETDPLSTDIKSSVR